MGKPTGFMEFDRELPQAKQPEERVKNYREFYQPFPEEKTKVRLSEANNEPCCSPEGNCC